MLMYNCELFSVKKNRVDYEQVKPAEEALESLLNDYNIHVKYHTDISPNPDKINDALTTSLMLSGAESCYRQSCFFISDSLLFLYLSSISTSMTNEYKNSYAFTFQ